MKKTKNFQFTTPLLYADGKHNCDLHISGVGSYNDSYHNDEAGESYDDDNLDLLYSYDSVCPLTVTACPAPNQTVISLDWLTYGTIDLNEYMQPIIEVHLHKLFEPERAAYWQAVADSKSRKISPNYGGIRHYAGSFSFDNLFEKIGGICREHNAKILSNPEHAGNYVSPVRPTSGTYGTI